MKHIRYLNYKIGGLIFAIALIGILASPVSPLMSKPSLTEYYGNVAVEYYSGGNGIELQVTTDKDVFGYIANAYIAVPYARFKYLGAWGSRDEKVTIPTEKWLDAALDKWRGVTNSTMEGQRIALLLFLSFVTKDYVKYDKILSAPIDLTLAKSSKVKVTLDVKLSKLRPSGFIDVNNLPKCQGCRQTQNVEVGEHCVFLGCPEGICVCYCARWVAPEDQYWTTDSYAFNPLLIATLNWNAYATETVTLYFRLYHQSVTYFGTLIGGIISGSDHQDTIGFYHTWTLDNRTLDFDHQTTFKNRRYYENAWPNYYDNAILAIGTYGAGAIGNFIKQEKTCECEWCDYVDYHDTDEHAVLVIWDLRVWDINGQEWYVPTTFNVDDNPYDNQGTLEKYVDFLMGQYITYRNETEILHPPDPYIYRDWNWSHGSDHFGLGFSILGLLISRGINPSVNINSDFGILPIFAEASYMQIFFTEMTIVFSTQYNYIYIYLYDHINKGDYLFEDYYYVVPVHHLSTYLLT